MSASLFSRRYAISKYPRLVRPFWRIHDVWKYAVRHRRPCDEGHIRREASGLIRRNALGWRLYRNGHCWKLPSLERLW